MGRNKKALLLRPNSINKVVLRVVENFMSQDQKTGTVTMNLRGRTKIKVTTLNWDLIKVSSIIERPWDS